ncbi:MAG: hypothetical protein RLZZ402_408 [Bacteroidota bacterium]
MGCAIFSEISSKLYLYSLLYNLYSFNGYPLCEFVCKMFFSIKQKWDLSPIFNQLYSLCFMLYAFKSRSDCPLTTVHCPLAKFRFMAVAINLNLCYNHRSPTFHILFHRLVLHIFFDASVSVLNSHALVAVCNFDGLARCRAFY